MSADLTAQLPEFVRGHQLAKIPDATTTAEDDYSAAHVRTEDIADAHIVLSEDPAAGLHRPVLDIDFPAALIPSSTPGHFHLYLDKPMGLATYEELLVALAAAGIIEDGYANVSLARGYTSARLPWVRKEAKK